MLEGHERYPRSQEAMPSFRQAFRHYVMPSYVPATPPLRRTDSIFTQGSCFAENIANSLNRGGVRATYLEIKELMNSPHASRTFMEYALTDKPLVVRNHKKLLMPEGLAQVRAAISQSAAIVLTVGLAYCRYGEETGDLKLIALKDEPAIVRLTSAQENQEHLEAIIGMLRAANPTIKIILTLSPIPILRSVGNGSAFTADCLSKSTLRVAIDQVMARNFPDVYYWPAFEGIRWLSAHFGPMYGVEGLDARHPGQSYVDEILDAFVDSFFAPAGT